MRLIEKDLFQYVHHVNKLRREAQSEIRGVLAELERQIGLHVDNVAISLIDEEGNRETSVEIRIVFPSDEDSAG